MIKEEQNPAYLNDFLDYLITIQNKSINTIKEYNYDLATFLSSETDISPCTTPNSPLGSFSSLI